MALLFGFQIFNTLMLLFLIFAFILFVIVLFKLNKALTIWLERNKKDDHL